MIVQEARHTIVHKLLGRVELVLFDREGTSITVLVYGGLKKPGRMPVRIQSACLYGDTLDFADCDCRNQMKESFDHFQKHGSGIFIYLDQEGRGAGLYAKARSYEYQDKHPGANTFDAYEALDLPLDSRDYEGAIEVLDHLKTSKVRLLTNNPLKVEALQAAGIDVISEPLRTPVTESNRAYLSAKETRLHHTLGIESSSSWEGNGDGVRAAVIGAAVMDHAFRMNDDLVLGSAVQAQQYARHPGGKGLNQAIGMARLGARVSLLTSRGRDADFEEIARVLAREGVTAHFAHDESHTLSSPQTAVLQPLGLAPTYVGWLGRSDRTLSAASIEDFSNAIGTSRALLLTLEVSEAAIRESLSVAPPGGLVVLTASPIASGDYEIDSAVLDDVDVIIGSRSELIALISSEEDESGATFGEVIVELSKLLPGVTIIGTDFRSALRRVIATNTHMQRPVILQSPIVRVTQRGGGPGVSAAVGNTDAFVAAFTVALLQLECTRSVPREKGVWRTGESSPLALSHNVVDALSPALSAEAWVTRSKDGGYVHFPKGVADYFKWSKAHPPINEDVGGAPKDER
jgi:GTP cyclohydrolase II